MNRLAGVDSGAAPFRPVSSSMVAARITAVTLAALAIGAAGSRGLPLPTSTDLYERAITATRDAPAWTGHTFEVVSEVGLVILAGAVLLASWRRRRSAHDVARSVASGVGVVLAYISSEGLKAVIAQPRPCLGLGSEATVARCPPATDWSLPSNHATIGMALAVALVLTVPQAARWAVPIALAVAISRVAIGVHHPHDVGSGMLLAATVVTGATLVFQAPIRLTVTRATRRWQRPST